MFKNPSGSAVINYGTSLPIPGTVPDGSLFYLTVDDPGLYVLSTLQDANGITIGSQPGLVWQKTSTINGSDFVAVAGDTMTGLLVTAAGLSTTFLSASGNVTLTGPSLQATGSSISLGTDGGAGETDLFLNGDVTISDLVPQLGNTSPVLNDGDRGFSFNYNNGANRTGFFGFDVSTGRFAVRAIATFSGDTSVGAVTAFDLSGTPLAELSDVAATAPAVGNVLAWNGTMWAPSTAAGGGVMNAFSSIANSAGTVQISAAGADTLRLAISDTSAAAPSVTFTTGTRLAQFNVPTYGIVKFGDIANTPSTFISLFRGSASTIVGQINLNATPSEGLFFQVFDPGPATQMGIRIRVDANAMAAHLATAATGFLTTGATAQTKTGALALNSTLSVGGTATFSGVIASTNNTNSTSAAGTNGAVRSLGGASFAGDVWCNDVFATGDVVASASDVRLKTNIAAIEEPLAKVRAINGVTFNWDVEAATYAGFDRDDRREVGVIAQEVQAVLPEVVCPSPANPKYLTVKYERLVPLLIEAIKAQQVQIEELQALVKGRD